MAIFLSLFPHILSSPFTLFVFSLDSLDFLSPFGRTIISRALRVGEYISLVSVQFRAIQWLAYLPFSAQGILIWAQIVDIVVHYISVFPCPSVLVRGWHPSPLAPRPLRHFPDTYPIHTRHIPDTYVYPMNTPRILRVYSTNTPKRLQK